MAKSLREELSSMKRKIRCIQYNENNSSTGGTKTSDLTNDGEDGLNPFITAQDIPAPVDLSGYATTAQLTTEKNRNDTQDGQIADLNIHQIKITTSASISTNTVGSVTGKGQNGRNVQISNSTNNIIFSCMNNTGVNFVSSYIKLGTGTVTFQEDTGITIVPIDGTKIMSGAIGSTASLSRDGSTYYLRISNV